MDEVRRCVTKKIRRRTHFQRNKNMPRWVIHHHHSPTELCHPFCILCIVYLQFPFLSAIPSVFLHRASQHGSLFYPEDGGSRFLRYKITRWITELTPHLRHKYPCNAQLHQRLTNSYLLQMRACYVLTTEGTSTRITYHLTDPHI
jgi:hypothetical protein